MKNKTYSSIYLVFVMIACLISINLIAQTTPRYQAAEDAVVIIEIESAIGLPLFYLLVQDMNSARPDSTFRLAGRCLHFS